MELNKGGMFDIVVVSPHLDDAILSLGQHLVRWKKEGKKLKVITVFTKFGSGKNLPDYSKDYLKYSGHSLAREFEKVRVKEDVEAMKMLGVDYEHWGFVDAGFREIYDTRKVLLGGVVDTRDGDLQQQIEKKIKKISADLLMVPYGVGGHVDHVMVKAASGEIKNKSYYLDVPYLWENYNFIKNLGKIVTAKSLMRGGEEKRRILKAYESQYNLLVKNENVFTEVII